MALMQAVYYRGSDGSEPVNDFIDGLNHAAKQATLDNQIDRLNMLRTSDPPLPFPWSSQVEGEFRELRCHCGSELYRVVYRRSRNLFILLHMFRKDTGQIKEADKVLARSRWEDFTERMDAERRKPPRAAGHDAP